MELKRPKASESNDPLAFTACKRSLGQVDSSGVFPSLPRAFKTSWQIAEPHRRGSGGEAGLRFCLVYDCHDCRRNGGSPNFSPAGRCLNILFFRLTLVKVNGN